MWILINPQRYPSMELLLPDEEFDELLPSHRLLYRPEEPVSVGRYQLIGKLLCRVMEVGGYGIDIRIDDETKGKFGFRLPKGDVEVKWDAQYSSIQTYIIDEIYKCSRNVNVFEGDIAYVLDHLEEWL